MAEKRLYEERREITGCGHCGAHYRRGWALPYGEDPDPEGAFGGQLFGCVCSRENAHIPDGLDCSCEFPAWCPLEKAEE